MCHLFHLKDKLPLVMTLTSNKLQLSVRWNLLQLYLFCADDGSWSFLLLGNEKSLKVRTPSEFWRHFCHLEAQFWAEYLHKTGRNMRPAGRANLCFPGLHAGVLHRICRNHTISKWTDVSRRFTGLYKDVRYQQISVSWGILEVSLLWMEGAFLYAVLKLFPKCWVSLCWEQKNYWGCCH